MQQESFKAHNAMGAVPIVKGRGQNDTLEKNKTKQTWAANVRLLGL